MGRYAPHKAQVHFPDDFAVGDGEQNHLDHFIAPTIHAHIHSKADDEVIVAVAGKGSLDIDVVHCGGVCPPSAFPAQLEDPATVEVPQPDRSDFNTDNVVSI